MLRKVVGLYYSPLGYSAEATMKLASEIAGNLSQECEFIDTVACECIDLMKTSIDEDIIFDNETVVVIGMPEKTGRLPLDCVKIMQKLHGSESMTVAVVMHTDYSYGESLYELYTFAEEQGFRVISAGAFIAETPSRRNSNVGRPDELDYRLLSSFAGDSSRKLARLSGCTINGLKVKPAPLYISSNRNAFTDLLRPVRRVIRSATGIVYNKRREPEWFL